MHVEEEVLGQSVDHQDGRFGMALRLHARKKPTTVGL